MPYFDDFRAATDRTRRFGLDVPHHEIEPDRRYLTAARQREFPFVMHKAIGAIGTEELMAQCMSIHHRLKPVIQDWLDVPVVYTIGWVQTKGEGLFKFDESHIHDLLQLASVPRTLGVHVWLTLPSMELIDLSLATTMAIVHNMPEGLGQMMAKHADDVTGMAYKPMLLGDGLLRRIGVLVEF